MDLILWRHADAEDSVPDMARKLTSKGEKQAEQMAAWLQQHLPKETKIFVSPAKRAQQTAQALSADFETVPALAPGAQAASILAVAEWPEAKGAVLIVGHQPGLGRAAALLLSSSEADWNIKKGNIWWLTNRLRQDDKQTLVRAVISPEFI